jgi:AraC family transcriptional regulator, transcriptional activator of pobA
MPNGKTTLVGEMLAAFENREAMPFNIRRMVLPVIQDKNKDSDMENSPALRRDFNLIYFIHGGIHDAYLQEDNPWLFPNDLVIIPENMVYASQNIQNCIGYCVYFKTEFIQPLLNGTIAEQFPFFDLEAEHIMHIAQQERNVMQRAFLDIINEQKRFSSEREIILRDLIHILLLRIREIYLPDLRRDYDPTSRNVKLSNRFKRLVEKNFLQIREVRAYADMLNITPQYLSDVVKNTIGKSPKHLINDMIFLEAKFLLVSTDKTFSEIAYLLQFNDQAHFNHFIRNQSGYSPGAIRKMH